MCGGKDRFRFDNKEGRGTWICNQCGSGDGWAMLQKALNTDFIGAAKQLAPIVGALPQRAYVEHDQQVSPDYLRQIFKESTKAHPSNLVGFYLKSRGIETVPSCLRLHNDLKEPDTGQKMPCMLALVKAPDATALTMHRTFLDRNGQKADIEKPKKLLPGLKKLTGASIQLSDVPEDGLLGIAEGIETALSCFQLFNIPTWAAVSAGMLEAWIPPKGVKKVAVFADNDKNYTGQAAAYRLANRLVVKDRMVVDVEVPELPGDFNDVLLWGG